jgi:hypothetical protein
MKKNALLGVFALMALGTLTMAGAYAFGGWFLQDEAVSQTLEAEDYNAFLTAVSERFADSMTEEKFGELVDKYNAKQAVDEAIENRDYNAWAEAVSEQPNSERLLELITEENFYTYAELHEAMNQVKELSDELGIQGLRGGMRRGMHGSSMRPCPWGE